MMITTAPPPPPQPMVTIPSSLGEANDYVQLMYQDPMIRRNGALDPGFTPPPDRQPVFLAQDTAAFADILRTNGDEFIPGYDTTVDPAKAYPVVVVKDSADGAITGENDPDAVAGANLIERSTGRLVLEVAALTPGGGGIGDPAVTYNFMVYDRNSIELGSGSFTFMPTGNFPTPPGLLDWGVNVVNRGTADVTNLDFDPGTNPNLRICTGDEVITATPPVVFFKFAGGSPYDYNQDEEQSYGTNNPPGSTNPYVYVQNTSDTKPLSMIVACRVAGITPDGSYLMIHTITKNDFDWPGHPGVYGILEPGQLYDLWLIDPATNPSRTLDNNLKFADNLVVVGNNPNDL
jgi:hypothetical protein